MYIRLVDLEREYLTIKQEIDQAVHEVLSSATYIMGEHVRAFEKEFSEYLDVKHAISVANGTDALVIALKASNIGKGDEVITTPFTFFATAESIAAVGAIPVFVDVDKDTFNINIDYIEEKITNKTKAIMPVHIFGYPANMDEIMNIAKRYSLKVIEDACQAIGAEYKGRKIGSIGDIACFSFFPTKNLGCAGDGGMIVTNDERTAVIARALRTHGSGKDGKKAYELLYGEDETTDDGKNYEETVYNPQKYYNYLIGYNSRLDTIQAAILRVKLKYLDQWNTKRIRNAEYYNQHLKNTSLICPFKDEEIKHVYHMYIVQSERREELIEYLKQNGIATGVYYPVPLHLQKAFGYLGYAKGSLPVSEYLSNRTFAIPIYPEMTRDQLDYVVQNIRRWDEEYGE